MLFIPCRPLPLSGGVAEWCNFAGDQCIANDNSGAHSIPFRCSGMHSNGLGCNATKFYEMVTTSIHWTAMPSYGRADRPDYRQGFVGRRQYNVGEQITRR